MMKVLFLTNVPSPYRVDFFNELGKLCDLTVLYEKEKADDRDVKWKSNSAMNYKSIVLRGKSLRADGALCLDIVKWIKKDKFDIYVIGGYSTPTGMLAIQLLKIKKIPFILSSDGGLIKKESKIKYLIKKYFISSANYWLSTGKETNSYLEYYGATNEYIYIYPFTSVSKKDILSGPISKEEKFLIKEKLNIESENVVISVGQYIYRKGYDFLLNLWEDFDEKFVLLIIGSGPDREILNEIIFKKNLKNVKLIGFKPKEELKYYYLAADYFILPTREDIWGLVINEALSYRLPIITTNKCVAGIEMSSKIKSINILDIDSATEFKKELNRILNYKQKDILDVKNEEAIEYYTIENMAMVHYQIFRKIRSYEDEKKI